MPKVSAESSSSPENARNLASYAPLPSRRDAAMEAKGSLRPEWTELFESIDRRGDGALTLWRNEAARLSRERGLAYRPDRIDKTDRDESWSLDPVPWVFSQDHWANIEKGVAQRLRLYSAILADLYGGSQRLFSEKMLPAEIILSHPGYVRAVFDLPPGPSCIGLGMAATDLAHDNTGRLFALNDRFDSPFGLGLSLENRSVVNAVLPNLFRRNHVRRIGHFFVDWFDYLGSCAPSESPTARVAIVDATPEDKDSEIHFLANYCGILRVIPSDLTVRSGKVWLKTVGGLEPIDVIWKYTAGRDLDPLETSQGYGRGIPGIFEAMRQGNISVASHPGSEVLQSPGFFPYLAKICQSLLGEALLIPPVATWWCGDEVPLRHVLANLATMVVKPVGHHHDFNTKYGSRLTQAERDELKTRIQAQPNRYVAQEEMMLSTVPVSTEHGLTPRGAVLRTFSFLGRNGAAHIMPGGLARVSTVDGLVVSTRQTGESKDVWVRAEKEDPQMSIASEVRRSRLISPEVVTSNAAENLYWVGRNAERVDFISRFMARIIHGRTLGFSYAPEFELEHESILVDVLFALNECESWLESATTPDEKLLLILGESKCPAAIAQNLANFRRTTNAARGKWSPASILAIESVCKGWSEDTRGLSGIFAFKSPLKSLQLNLAAFLGLNLDSMTRNHGWAMLDTGRRIERAINIVKLLSLLLRKEVASPIESLLNESILFISDSLGTYQSIYFTEPRTGPMLRLLLGERNYPRSLKFLFNRLRSVLAQLPKPAQHRHPRGIIEPASDHLQVFCDKIDRDLDNAAAIKQFAAQDLDLLAEELRALNDHLTKSYFSHASRNAE